MTFPFPLFSKFSSLKITFYIALLLIFVILINNYFFLKKNNGLYEGFTQDKKFLLKQDNDIYDNFYIDIYDKLNDTEERTNYDVNKIITLTNIDKNTTYILDVGCGTGVLVNQFLKKGILIKGIDKSQNMIDYANNKNPVFKNNNESSYQCMDIEDSNIFKQSTFSHILCLYMTIYEIQNKLKFFYNSYYSLKSDGFLIIHLIKTKNDYNGFINLGKPKALNENDIYNSDIKKLQTNFGSFTYNKDWSDIYNLKESFTDNKTNFIRQNNLTWYYEPIDIILQQIKSCGFSIYDIVPEYKNIGGYLYFFKKPGIFNYKNLIK